MRNLGEFVKTSALLLNLHKIMLYRFSIRTRSWCNRCQIQNIGDQMITNVCSHDFKPNFNDFKLDRFTIKDHLNTDI